MKLICILLIGLIAGWLSGRITRGHGFGLIGNLVVGVMGSFVGWFLLGLLGFSAHGVIGDFLTAVLGAIVFLFLLGFIKGGGKRSSKKEGKE